MLQNNGCIGVRRFSWFALAVILISGAGMAQDWPMWGYDAARSGAAPAALELPSTLHLQWVRELAPPQRAWPAQHDDGDKLEFDLSYAPVVYNDMILVGSMVADRLTAYSMADGSEVWRFYAGGPVRLAPAAWDGRVYFGADDGYFYCLNADTGALQWKFKAAPADHRVLGNTRVISMWPVRGGPVVMDGMVYFAAGVWPFLGTMLYALDAETGSLTWANTAHADTWQAQPHGGAYAFAGLSPQGYLAAAGDRLVVSGGRSYPALFDRATGALLRSQVRGAKGEGGYRVRIQGDYYFNHGRRYHLDDGRPAGAAELSDDAISALLERTNDIADQLDAPVFESLVASGRLLAVTQTGRLYCFGPDPVEAPLVTAHAPGHIEAQDTDAGRRAAEILARSGINDGYALVLGGGDGALLKQLAARSNLRLVVLEPDAGQVARLRRELDDAGIYGTRISVLAGAAGQTHYPAYISSLVVAPDPAAAGMLADVATLQWVYERLRPYTGRAWLGFDPADRGVQTALAGFEPEAGSVDAAGGALLLKRQGPLPGSGQWTHQYADAAQTVMSDDYRVRPPFGPIWFGGVTHDNVLPRHSLGPRPQVSSGRLVILGVETISARCVFTGRELWVREFPGIGHPFTNLELEARWAEGEGVYMTNQPGSAYIGSPYVTLSDGVYVRYRGKVYRLDPDTGAVMAEWELPARAPVAEDAPEWGHISVNGDFLVTTTDPDIFRGGALGTHGDDSWDGSSSRRLAVLNRHTGQVLWTREAQVGFRHNTIISAGQRLFVNDLLSEQALQMAVRRGMQVAERPRLYALDLATGNEIWNVESDVFGTFLSYSEEFDVLLETGTRDGRRHVGDEPVRRITARRGADGTIIWSDSGHGPVILRGDMIIPPRPGTATALLTGANAVRVHPVTGQETSWSYWKTYGCGTANAGPHLLLFRSGAAGFTELEHDGGTGMLGGFRAGCTASMVPADGVLNAPDYTRTCTCNYQNQTSLGLIHMPEMDMWTVNPPISRVRGRLERLGINLGAPGDRRAADGTLWVPLPRTDAPALGLDIILDTYDYDATPLRIVAVSASASAEDAGKSLDGNAATRWEINCNREGEFGQWIRYEFDEIITVDRIKVAWRAPTGTLFRVEISTDRHEWTEVHQETGRGPGNDLSELRFDPLPARFVRISFGSHGGELKDRRGRANRYTAHVSQLRVGGLEWPAAYSYFMPKNLFRDHTLSVDGAAGPNWVAASGVHGFKMMELSDVNGEGQSYKVRLHFSEPDDVSPGDRVFDVRLQGRTVAGGVDVVQAAGGRRRSLVKEFPGIALEDNLRVELVPAAGSDRMPLLSGVELIAE